MEQRSYEWQQARLGHITASAAECIVEGSRQDMKDAETKARILSCFTGDENWPAANIASDIHESRSRVDRVLALMIKEGTIAEGAKRSRSKTYLATGTASPEPEITFSKAAQSYCYELIAERITGEAKQIWSPAMQWGIDHEPEARECAAEAEGVDILDPINEWAFVSREPWIGASPDGLIGDEGLCEIQCPYSA